MDHDWSYEQMQAVGAALARALGLDILEDADGASGASPNSTIQNKGECDGR